jgi:hypothetical protein
MQLETSSSASTNIIWTYIGEILPVYTTEITHAAFKLIKIKHSCKINKIRKTTRRALSYTEKMYLEMYYSENNAPNFAQITQICRKFRLAHKVVKSWFSLRNELD